MSASTTAKMTEGQRAHLARLKQIAEQAWQVSGWRVLYQIGIEERWFEGSFPTPFESVFRSDWRAFVGAYCLKMSRL